MTSKPTTFSDAGLSIALVETDTVAGKNTVRPLRRRCRFRYIVSGSVDNGSYGVKQEQRLALISGLPDSGVSRDMRPGKDDSASQALVAQHQTVKDYFLSMTKWPTLSLRRRPTNCLASFIYMTRIPCGTTAKGAIAITTRPELLHSKRSTFITLGSGRGAAIDIVRL